MEGSVSVLVKWILRVELHWSFFFFLEWYNFIYKCQEIRIILGRKIENRWVRIQYLVVTGAGKKARRVRRGCRLVGVESVTVFVGCVWMVSLRRKRWDKVPSHGPDEGTGVPGKRRSIGSVTCCWRQWDMKNCRNAFFSRWYLPVSRKNRWVFWSFFGE